MPATKEYLGDGAYVADGCYAGEVVLTTEDGVSVQNRVVMGPTEVAALLRFLEVRYDLSKACPTCRRSV